MRARIIKPGYFKNDELLECHPLARILFAGLWCMADREGRLKDRPARLKIEILPMDNCDINQLLDQLDAKNFIIRYEADGEKYIQITKFKENQRPHNNEAKSEIPEYSITSKKILSTKDESASHHGSKHFALNTVTCNLDPDPSLTSEERVRATPPPEVKRASKNSNSSRLPFETTPAEWAEWANVTLGWSSEITSEVWSNFRDHWQNKTGTSSRKSDWFMTWKNWCRKERIAPQRTNFAFLNGTANAETEHEMQQRILREL